MESSGTTFDGPRREFAVAKQMNLVLANMFWTEAIGRTVEVLREILYGVDLGTDGVLSVVASLELVQHQLPETGHSDLLVTQNLTRATMLAADHAVAVALFSKRPSKRPYR